MSNIANLSALDFDVCIDDVATPATPVIVHELPEFKEISIKPVKPVKPVKVVNQPAKIKLPTTSDELYEAVGLSLPPVAAHKLGISTEEYNELERKLFKPKTWRPPAMKADAVERDMWRSAPGGACIKWIEEVKTLDGKERENTGEELQDIILRKPAGHEVFKGNVRPYYDIDIKDLPGKTKADTKAYRAKWTATLCAAHAAIREIWPLCTIHTFSSSGRTSADTYKVSFHFIISGAGYYKVGKDIPTLDVEGFDTQAYKGDDRRQCFRLPYAEAGKSGGQFPRFKLYVKIADAGVHATDPDDVCEEMADALQYWQYENWLPSFIKGEKLQHVEESKYAKQAADVKAKRAPPAVGTAAEEAAKLAGLLAIIPNNAAIDWGTWQAIIWGAKRHACLSECYAEGYSAVHAWSAKSPKYNETDTDLMWMGGKEDHPGGYTIGTLHYYAKLHNKAEYYAWVKSVTKVKKGNKFDHRDPYCWYDFHACYSKSHWPSKDAMIKAVMADAPRVIAWVQESGGFYVQKINCEHKLFSQLKTLGKNNFWLTYDVEVPATKKTEATVKTEKIQVSEIFDNNLTQFAEYTCNFSLDCPERIFNINIGMTAELLPEHDDNVIKDLLRFLYVTVCNSNDECYKFLINLFACSMQKPDVPVGVALVLHGVPGTGKDTFIEFLRKFVFGEHFYCGMVGVPAAAKTFNKKFEGKKLFHISETASTSEQFLSNYDVLKDHYTCVSRYIEPKSVDPYPVACADLWILATNHDDSIHTEKGDRRYFMVTMDPRTAKNRAYFEQVRKQIMNKEAGDHFYTYLMSYDADYALLSNIPETTTRINAIEASSRPSVRFARYIAGLYPENQAYSRHVGVHMPASALYRLFCEWCQTNGERVATAAKFGREIAAVFQKGEDRNGAFYNTTKLI